MAWRQADGVQDSRRPGQPVGFAEEEALIPYPLNTFRGYRYLQEYFAFQDKFLFVDVNGLDILKALPEDTLKQMRGLELRFDIRKSGSCACVRPWTT
jgi:type VI secretion system protein ImpG